MQKQRRSTDGVLEKESLTDERGSFLRSLSRCQFSKFGNVFHASSAAVFLIIQFKDTGQFFGAGNSRFPEFSDVGFLNAFANANVHDVYVSIMITVFIFNNLTDNQMQCQAKINFYKRLI